MISESQDRILYLKQTVQKLQQSTILGSAITMCLLPNKNVNEYRNLLASQIAQASNIKDKPNKNSVIQGLKSARQALKDYKKVPSNGLIVLSANVIACDNNGSQKILEVIEPERPITKEVYSCGKNFNFAHINEEILVNDQTFGFIILDGNSCLLAKTKGTHRQILKELKSDIMRNHNKGGQSSVRFSRLRDQSGYNYVKNACQQANIQFGKISDKILGYILAGSANLKMDFVQNQALSPNIKSKIIRIIDVAQGSQQGLKQAIFQSKQVIMDASLFKQRQILSEFFLKINKDSEKTTNGLNSVIEMIQIGIAQKVICAQILDKRQKEYIQELCQANGCSLLFISDKSQESQIFIKSYGGIGAFMRYQFNASFLKEQFLQEQTCLAQKQDFFL